MSGSFPDFLYQPVDEVAQQLLGCIFERVIGQETVRVRIVETESYDQDDAASHAFGGRRQRNATMFEAAGHLYVYFTYGMHYCCNVVTGPKGFGSGVLIRAVQPVTGQKILEANRGVGGVQVTNGPAKTCQALEIDLAMNGHDLHRLPMRLLTSQLSSTEQIASSIRIGISKARDQKRRFYIKDNPFVSASKIS